ncbi:uncharacterized protein [Aegilops tauschii subsp. strangulata]|nr:splicing factor, arginine/serine-rich 19 [Aegilops tauschii subsp. strangulata]XP_044421055.1 splicing factor, arginine/serine-rich 19-like [Triticum aestivum]
MAPKRAAKKAAPPPPPPPPAASSEETDSRSRSEESDEDAESPPPAPTPAPKSTPAPPQEGEEEEESEEEEEEEESDEEPAHASPAAAATPKNKPPPPQQGGDSDSSDEEEEEEEEEEVPTKAAPLSALKKQPPPPPPRQSEESDASDEEEEEGESEEEAPPPPPKLAPKQAPEGRKPQAAAETKKPAAFSRIWSTDDEVRILEALAAHQKQHGTLPQPDALVDALAGKLDNRAYGSKELQGKVAALRRRYLLLSKKGELPSKEHDRRVLELSKMVWEGGDMASAATASAKVANGQEPKGFEEMCEMYPYLAEQVRQLDAANPGMFKRQFGMMDEEKARAMDEKIKKQRVAQMKVELRRHDLVREVTKAIIDLVD